MRASSPLALKTRKRCRLRGTHSCCFAGRIHVKDVFLARQPIFNRDVELFGYELLFRADDSSDSFDGADTEAATTQVIASSILSIGLDNVIGRKKAFVNFNEALLRSGLHAMLPRDQSVQCCGAEYRTGRFSPGDVFGGSVTSTQSMVIAIGS